MSFAIGAGGQQAGGGSGVCTIRHLGILQKSISFRTGDGAGQVPAYGEYLKSALVEVGYAPGDITIEPVANTATLVARYKGTDSKKKPLLVIGHMDVVEAKREDWQRDLFTPRASRTAMCSAAARWTTSSSCP